MPKRHETNEMQGLRERLPKRLRAAMAKESITGRDLAAKMKVKPSTISDWRHGRSLPTLENLFQLARILKEPASFLIGDRLPRKDSIEGLSRELGTTLGYRRLNALNDMDPDWLIAEINRLIGSYVADTHHTRRTTSNP